MRSSAVHKSESGKAARWLFFAVPALVFIGVAALGVVAATAAQRSVDAQETQARLEAANRVGTGFQTVGIAFQTQISGMALAAETTQADRATMEALLGQNIADGFQFDWVSVFHRDTDGTVSPILVVGTDDPVLPDGADVARAIDSAVDTRGVAVGLRPDGLVTWIGFAASGPSREYLVYGELAMPSFPLPAESINAQPFDLALYVDVGGEPTRILTTTSERLVGDDVIRQDMTLGGVDAYVLLEPVGQIIGGGTRLMPRLVLIMGLVFGVALAVLTARMQRAKVEAVAAAERSDRDRRALGHVLENVPDLIASADTETRRVSFRNREELLGWPPESFSTLDMVHPDDRRFTGRQWEDLVSGRSERISMEFRVVPRGVLDQVGSVEEVPADSWEWFRVRAGIMKFEDGRPLELLAVVSQVTAEHDAESERKRLQEQLNRSQRLEAVGQLAGGVAHDFNNLMATVQSYSELLIEDVDDSQAREDLEEIRQAARRGSDLTRQLLAFSRAEASTAEPVNLNQSLHSMRKLLSRAVGEDIELELKLNDELPMVSIDPVGVEQIFMNLVVNARDAMPDGGRILVETRVQEVDEDMARTVAGLELGRYVKLTVTDEGSGMDRATREKAFDPFFTTKEVGKGTGLGLATVYGIVQQANGYVSIYSEVDRGTSIAMFFPALDQIAEGPTGDGPDESEDSGNEHGGVRILLVEDEPSVREAARRILDREGFVVVTAESGPEALSVDGIERFDVLLTDIVMPGGLSGTQVAAEIRRVNEGIGVVYMSGYSAEAVANHGVLEEGIELVNKPFSRQEIVGAVVRAAGLTMAAES